MGKNPKKSISNLIKTVALILFSLYLGFALALYQIWDSSPPGIIGGLFTSIAAFLDSLIGISIWFIIISLYALLAIRLNIIAPINISKSALVFVFLCIAGISGDGALGGIVNSFINPLFGELTGKVILTFILLICIFIISRNSGREFYKRFRSIERLFILIKKKLSIKGLNTKKSIEEETSIKVNKSDDSILNGKTKLASITVNKSYNLPSLDLLDTSKEENSIDQDSLKVRAIELEKAILPFEFVKVSKWIPGPMATTFYTELEADAKVSNLLSRSNDIARSLGLPDDCVRISGNIQGQKNIIGIELPNPERSFCLIREVLEHPSYKDSDATLPLALGIGIDGDYICEDLSAMPHLLLAGSTGSGKTVALNVILLSLIYRKTPSELNLVLIDPKLVEFSLYRGIPHLLGNIVTDMDESVHVLQELINLMESRYQKFQNAQVTKISEYNSEVTKEKRMPHTVVFIDELGDLMLTHGRRVEDLLGRLSQKARAAGIHLVVATQRPTSDIIKGLIKANIPARLAFKVSNQVDSRVILGSKGAESMLGKGDCLLQTTESKSLKRIQSPLVTTEEIKKVVNSIN